MAPILLVVGGAKAELAEALVKHVKAPQFLHFALPYVSL